MGVWVVIVVSYLVYLRKHPQLHAASKFKAPGGAISAWIVLAFMGCMGVILACGTIPAPASVYSLIWIAFIVGAALREPPFPAASRVAWSPRRWGNGRGSAYRPPPARVAQEYQVTMLTRVPRELEAS